MLLVVQLKKVVQENAPYQALGQLLLANVLSEIFEPVVSLHLFPQPSLGWPVALLLETPTISPSLPNPHPVPLTVLLFLMCLGEAFEATVLAILLAGGVD